jgi:hypothetical protein
VRCCCGVKKDTASFKDDLILEGKFFLEQQFDLVHGGRKIKGIEVIGHLHLFDGQPSQEIRTRVYSFTDGMTLDYVYELEGETLTI